ncbi:alginate export family protein [Pseudomonas sp. 14P_8.1_Bac3]|uniref:alginate export family protein n=1 Tax=Pseudomonas sp. 14P_8.1_Bac3 TaxID=2971621 RepID=UPI0021C82494|nr:alginate export family protein [Pseudomonas sp. 14P_8.1_Bac3]MCU1758456.1 alginate export family protein [Pseudomonas sp. 14P_8.1_Bac3]
MSFITQLRTLSALGALISQCAVAGYAFDAGDVKGEATLAAGAASLNARHVNFGSGRVDLRNGRNTGERADWQEMYLKPGMTLNYELYPGFEVFGGASAVGAATLGDGDAGGYTRSSDHDLAVEAFYAGVRKGDWTFSAGRQDFKVGTGFIVMDGNLDFFDDAAYWIGPRTAFRDSAIVRYSHDRLSAQAFSLRTDDDLGDFRMNGLNVDYDLAGAVTLGAMAMKVNSLDREANIQNPREGMQVYNLRALQGKVPGLDDLTLHGEYAVERGSGAGVDYDARAWYAQADYAFPSFPLQPLLSYRYAYFSGDDDPTDTKKKAWDPLSKGYVDWGTWLIGDVVGNYLLFNSNERVSQWTMRTHLTPTVSLGGIHYQFDLDEKMLNGVAVSDRRFADENVVFLEWTPTPSVYTSVSYNWVKPLAAARETYGNDDFSAIEMFISYRY